MLALSNFLSCGFIFSATARRLQSFAGGSWRREKFKRSDVLTGRSDKVLRARMFSAFFAIARGVFSGSGDLVGSLDDSQKELLGK